MEKHGGPAFPTVDNWRIDSGMTLRDYFAATAMAQILARWGSHQEIAHASIAALSYSMADAMITERAK